MNLTLRRVCPTTAIVAATLAAIAAFGSVRAWAVQEDSEEAPHLMVTGDFNRDGIADMAEATPADGGGSGHGLLTILLGQADGTFKKAFSEPLLGSKPRSIVAGDFNKDGMLDVIVGDDDGSVMLFLGDGAAHFAPAVDIARFDSVVSISVADLNRDGIPDLAITDWRASSVTVLLGMGDASFQRGWTSPLRLRGTTPHVAAADFNGDGILDLVVVYDDDDGATFDVMLGHGNGTFTYSPDLSVVKDPNSHCAA
jgi:FG-GAP-like repeat